MQQRDTSHRIFSLLDKGEIEEALELLIKDFGAAGDAAKERGEREEKKSALAKLARTLQLVRSTKVVFGDQQTEDEGTKMAASEAATIKRVATLRESDKGKDLGSVGPKAHVADIVYHGEKLILPSGMAIMDAVGLLLDKQEHLEKPISFNEKFDALPYDGAYAINEVLAAKYGWAQSVATPGFFGPTPPAMLNVAVGVGKFKSVPWGSFSIPGVDGRLETGVQMTNGRFQFTLSAQIKRKDEETVREIFQLVRVHLKENSIYRGQALKIRFKDDSGDRIAMPEPEFIDTNKIDRTKLIYSADVMDAVETNLFAPIERVQDFVDNQLPIKRTVMLAGTYGTGKTMAATVASKIAVENNITYIYCARADELTEALEFARQYQSPASVVFCEDIDRELDGERDAIMDDMLNLIDGVDTKHSNIITVLTSNAIEKINAAMLRPGRLDAIIDVTPPDAEAVVKLIRSIAGESIDATTNLDQAGAVLAGSIPAVISEVVKRAKIVQLRRQDRGTKVTKLGEDAVLEAAKTMSGQLTLLKNAITNGTPEVPALDQALGMLVRKQLRADLVSSGS